MLLLPRLWKPDPNNYIKFMLTKIILQTSSLGAELMVKCSSSSLAELADLDGRAGDSED